MQDRRSKNRAGHTPTPWMIKTGLKFAEGRLYICDKDGQRLALILQNGYQQPSLTKKEAEANAAFIVRAVNCHEELVEMLRGLATHPSLKISVVDMEMIGRLIAKAEGK